MFKRPSCHTSPEASLGWLAVEGLVLARRPVVPPPPLLVPGSRPTPSVVSIALVLATASPGMALGSSDRGAAGSDAVYGPALVFLQVVPGRPACLVPGASSPHMA